MPTYQYVCTQCGEPTEAVQSFTDAPLTECPACAGVLRKVFSAVGVVFKGSGFYKNDSRSTSGANGAARDSGDKATGDKPAGEKSSGDKASGGEKSSGNEKSSGDKSSAAKLSSDKPSGGGGSGDRPGRSTDKGSPATSKTPERKSA